MSGICAMNIQTPETKQLLTSFQNSQLERLNRKVGKRADPDFLQKVYSIVEVQPVDFKRFLFIFFVFEGLFSFLFFSGIRFFFYFFCSFSLFFKVFFMSIILFRFL